MMIKVKKLYPYRGFVGVKIKSYEIDEAIRAHKPLTIQCGIEKMTIRWEELESKIIDQSTPIASKLYPGTYYSLVGFRWMPKTQEEQLREFSQQSL